MNNNINIRKITDDDYAFINKWWVDNGKEIPPLTWLPEKGLGGLIIEKEKPIAAAYIYTTNSSTGYIDFLISDPNYKSKDRFNVLLSLFEACLKQSHDLGYSIVWAMTDIRGVIERATEIGFSVHRTDLSVITYSFK